MSAPRSTGAPQAARACSTRMVGAVIMAGYGLALTAAGIIQTRRRDVT